MVKPFVISLAVGVLSGAASAAYPATYPFENEIYEVASPPAATPSLTFDDEDPGGYMYTYVYMLTELLPGKAWANNGYFQHNLKVNWGISPIMPYSMFNCTAREEIFGENEYTFDSIAGYKFCDSPEECCTQFRGMVKYRREDDDAMEQDSVKWEEMYTAGLCTEMFLQDTFCSVLNEYLVDYCNEQLVTETERLVNQVCYDATMHWYTNCPVFKNTVSKKPGQEPDAYMEAMSPEEYLSWYSMGWLPDKVCTPYSYYYPEMAKSESDSAASDSAASDSAASDSDETNKSAASESDSAATAIVASLAGLVVLTM